MMALLLILALGVSPEQCGTNLEAFRSQAQESLYRLERHFVNAGWQYQRYRETVYVPLWQAGVLVRDRYSPDRNTRGTVEQLRYAEEARTYQRLARDEIRRMFRSWHQLHAMIRSWPALCGVRSFDNCSSLWQENFRENMRLLGQLLNRHNRQQRDLNRRVLRTLEDTPSQHHDLGTRYQDVYEKWQTVTYPALLERLRKTRELLREETPDNCCGQCSADELKISQDPVLNQIRPDPQSAESISGQVINQAGLMPAFADMEKVERGKTDREG